jgi:hypothetical protein
MSATDTFRRFSMRYKATFLVGFGTGYVLGSKAGRQRYEQIMKSFRQFTGRPEVQEAAGLVEGKAEGLVKTAKRVVTDKFSKSDTDTKTPAYAGSTTGTTSGTKPLSTNGTGGAGTTSPTTSAPYPS